VQCPKDRRVDLVHSKLSGSLPSMHCPTCQGSWISDENYKTWQSQQPEAGDTILPKTLDVDFEQAPFDSRAALCPECSCYLTRAKVGLLRTPFFIERCPNCAGIWCDRGEWDMLEKLGLHAVIEKLFSNEWQGRVREISQYEQERRATIDKLGEDLAARVFELAEVLASHPNGDFGVAYLMRRFDK
jgi:Zn-finger nucleic acid-binding protein